jgi:hypothetical protein
MAQFDPQSPEIGYPDPIARSDVAQIVGVVGGPIALLLGLQAKYTVVEVWACKSSAGPLVVHLMALLTLLLAVGAGVIAHRQWRGAGREDPGDPADRAGRTRTMASVGVGLSALSALIIVAQWLPQLFVSPCAQ